MNTKTNRSKVYFGSVLHGQTHASAALVEKYGLGTRNYELVEVISPVEAAKLPPSKQVYEG
jgi:hypothetical protein